MPEEITPEDVLYRRIFKYYVVPQEGNRISNSAFMKGKKRPDPECSVYVERLMASPDEPMLAAAGGQVLITLSAAVPIQLGIDLIHDPIGSDLDGQGLPAQPGHAIMCLRTKEDCVLLADASTLVSGV